MRSIQYQKDENNIVHLVLDKPDTSVNLMDAQFAESLSWALDKLCADDFIGVIIRSNKNTFLVGGDINLIFETSTETADELLRLTENIKKLLRTLETQGKPVVACISGAALGGGFEIALAAHYRIALNDPKVLFGLPEVTFGLLPGEGGITRMVRMLGLEASMPLLLEGKKFTPNQGVEWGLVDQLVDDPNRMMQQALQWILQNPQVQQPWDREGYRLPGGDLRNTKIAQLVSLAPAMLTKKTAGVLPAPEKILATMVEGIQVDFDTASAIETGYFIELACHPVTKNMINTFWFQLNKINSGCSRPPSFEKSRITQVGVLGAGMMGAGIAYACASKGMRTILKDVDLGLAEKGKMYTENLLEKQFSSQKTNLSTEEKKIKKESILALIQPSDNSADLAACDLVIEAVFENRALKTKVIAETEAFINKEAIFASNTSTLPITSLAKASRNSEKFIGLHFFSPVDKMPLVEIILGKNTSQETLAHSYDFVQQIGKIPIVVNDSRGFFTSRVFATYVKEGMAMLGEGISAASIENGAALAGFPVGPLAVTDEVSLTLIEKIRRQTTEDCLAEAVHAPVHPADKVIDRMLAMGRTGKLLGAGFYDYPATAKKSLWSGLKTAFYQETQQISLDLIQKRLLTIMALESIKCLQEGVLTSSHDANIGSIFGFGFPAWTGGVVQYIHYIGVKEFLSQACQLSDAYGKRFTPPQLLLEKAQNNQRF